MFALAKWGAGAKPRKRNGVILRRVRRPLGAEESRADRVAPRTARCLYGGI